jgi:hypothetical protein
MAAFDLWTPEFCLGCDRQTDGAAYCSESCKLAEFEKTGSAASSPASSSPSSPSVYGAPAHPWSTAAAAAPSAGFHLAPAYDFRSSSHRAAPSSSSSLTPSSSYSSLCSMQTASSTAAQSPANADVSERSRKELRDYAMSFEHARLQRRRSY